MTIIGMCAALNSFTWTFVSFCVCVWAQIWRRIKGNLRRVGRGHGYMHHPQHAKVWGGGDPKSTENWLKFERDAFLLIGIISRPFIGYVGDTTYIELYIFYSQYYTLYFLLQKSSAVVLNITCERLCSYERMVRAGHDNSFCGFNANRKFFTFLTDVHV